MRFTLTTLLVVFGCSIAEPAMADDGSRLLSVDHYVRVDSTVPAIRGETSAIYLREVVLAGTALRHAAAPGHVVLFVHGAPKSLSTSPIRTTVGWHIWPAGASTCSPWIQPVMDAPRGRRP